MDRAVILNGNVITYNGIQKKNLLIENGIITNEDFRGILPPEALVIDVEDMYVSPGFVEIHAHGGGGCDFMDATDEAFDTVVNTHLAHGTTSLMPTTVAASREAMSVLFSKYRTYKDKCPINLMGLHLEGPFVSQEMRGAQNPFYVRTPEKYEVDSILEEAGDIISMCTAAPELKEIGYMAEKMTERGIVLSCGHSDGIFDDIQKGYEMGFRHITHLYSNTPTVRKINQVIYAGVREAAYLIDEMDIELIGDGHHLASQVLQLALKVKGADRINLTSDAMRAAGTDVTESYLGEIKPENIVIIEDGVAKLPDRSYYAGSIATGDIMLRWAVEKCGISLTDTVKMMCSTPARIAGIDNHKGTIAKGMDADIIVFNKNFEIEKVMCKGILKI